jgi:hypothetical protein
MIHLILLSIGLLGLQGCVFSDCSLGSPKVVKSVTAGPDLAVDAGMSKCSFTGYSWTCEACSPLQVSIGDQAEVKGKAASQEWISTDESAVFAASKSLKTTATITPGAPPHAGCVDQVVPLELRVIDGAGVLHTDPLTVTVHCCGN